MEFNTYKAEETIGRINMLRFKQLEDEPEFKITEIRKWLSFESDKETKNFKDFTF